MRYCAGCRKLHHAVYLHHGKLYCGLCLNPESTDDLLVRCRMARIRVATYRAVAHGEPLPSEPLPLAEGRLTMPVPHRAIGCIEIECPEGTRSFPVTGNYQDLVQATSRADDLWEAYHRRLRVRVYRFFADGGRTCICHLPPLG